MEKVLDVKNITISIKNDRSETIVVDSVNFHLKKGEVLGIVGESGCGKSITSLSIMGLLQKPQVNVTEGEILFKNKNLLNYNEKQMRDLRGNDIAMIFQEPMTSLNPLFKIGDQLQEAYMVHHRKSRRDAKERAVQMLKLVGLPRAEQLMKEYPHQLSGGMRQRVMIAMAMICDPEVLIADEPTTALDVTIQAQILALMKDLNEKLDTSIIFITHDLGVVAEMCDRILVMYAGRVVEEGDVKTIFTNPQHPYTRGLLQSVPDIRIKKEKLYSISGQVPKPGTVKYGCTFAQRCDAVHDRCRVESPDLYKVDSRHHSRCFLVEEGDANDKLLIKS
ncbi:ATP-binding cassette domain-containing protein [Bacillus lacus]|uniref:ATP-binding cassette domain-containing protein n=1 Tax=Metabacillus lacus TaxID=1983721 RepID=A0A7X2LZS9_9BACI|nr:ABC transporter ATP-binding protein [Metabacillus lacus]MRX73761.1 ATP-binding cassette domain-containing protein [Metabacillus lacus]